MTSVTITASISDAAGSVATATATASTTSQFPTAATTGVPGGTAGMSSQPSGGTSITASVSNKSFSSAVTVTASNITIDHCYFAGGLHLWGSNITAQNCYIKGSIVNTAGFVSLENTGCKLLNSEVDGGTAQVSQDAIWMGSGTTVQGCNIHGWSKGVYCSGSNLVVSGNYIWNMVSSGEHVDSIFIDGYNGVTIGNINISGNSVNCNLIPGVSVAGPVFIKNDFGPVNGVTVNGNLLVGGGYTVWPGTNLATVSHIAFTNNTLGIGQYGYAYPGWVAATNTWTGNTDQVTGQPIGTS